MGQNSEIVSAFIDAFRQADLDRIMDFFEEDAVFVSLGGLTFSGTTTGITSALGP